MKIIGVSGSGIGAGKSSFCRKLTDETWSLAGGLREELLKICPEYDWHNKTQEYKNAPFHHSARILDSLRMTTLEDLPKMRSVRDALIVYGQYKCDLEGERYWVRQLSERLDKRLQIADGCRTVGIDDVRKIVEVEYLREKYGKNFLHFHIVTSSAVKESQFDNESLSDIADYRVSWETFRS